ncbi:ATP-dependent DNA helicase PIF1-like [Hydractinia symbiolongicarpus]|uniref:ATP-dependent DNA helicase PIF1-like n=1 Tax=Hydractinia symbiolongicarpus TaxID=13093 RepID=UPI0025516A74|nr:ATP-dependent DNA helicase PIF1-like [Hydractinia symbiolongicarpus]
MRTRPGEQQFAAWLLQLGKGVLPVREQEPFQGAIEVPSQCVIQNECIVDTLFRDLSPEIMASSVVLTPTNDDSLIINDQVLALLPGEEKVYFSADDVVCDEEEERNQYPVEFLNSITPSGMPPHCLKLKTGAIVMLLRNININNGLCNGTRLIIRRLHDNCVDAEVLTGNAIGDRVLIPRVQLAPSDTGMPFVLRRRQLPLRLSYAMTINKAQGQTFEKVGILLRRPCFSHGQLYVAFSRARAFGVVRVSVVPSSSRNSILCTLYLSAMLYKVQKVDVLE